MSLWIDTNDVLSDVFVLPRVSLHTIRYRPLRTVVVKTVVVMTDLVIV
jgi:hypothetical protein